MLHVRSIHHSPERTDFCNAQTSTTTEYSRTEYSRTEISLSNRYLNT